MIRSARIETCLFAVERLSLPILVLSLAACAGGWQPASVVTTDETLCVEPRPEVCTMDYRPVCARRKSGEARTYSNACGACADPQVEAHRSGTCE